MSSERMHLDLELALDSEPIAGRLSRAGEEQVTFTGYTGLIAALERVRDGRPDQAASERDRGPTSGEPGSGRNTTGGSG